jgi:hypothetical protein
MIHSELLDGAIDTHVHSAPDVMPRMMDHVETAEHYAAHGFRAIVLKCHHHGTADRIPLVTRAIEGIDVFGGLVLNYAVGGINPFAVDTALRYGAKVIWMPTVDAANHVRTFGTPGQFGAKFGGRATVSVYDGMTGLTVLDDRGEVSADARTVLELIAAQDVILSVGHLAADEIVPLVAAAKEAGVQRMWVDHPNLYFTRLDAELQQKLVGDGVYMNYTFSEISPKWHSISAADMAENIRKVGAGRVLLSGDTGQHHNPMPADAIRVLAQVLLEEGIPVDDLKKMISTNAAGLLYG